MYGVDIIFLLFFLVKHTGAFCSIRDIPQYGGPCTYNKSTSIQLGSYRNSTPGYVNGTGVYVNKLIKIYDGPGDQMTDHGPYPGYISSVSTYQLNLERNPNVFTYNGCSDLPYGSVEEWNLAHTNGNRVDGDRYIIYVDKDATSSYVCTPGYLQRCLTTASGFSLYDLTATSQETCSGLYTLSAALSVCELETDVQWSMTGYGITQLRGSVVEESGTLRLIIKNSEYRHIGQFNQIQFSLPATNHNGKIISDAFTPYYGAMYTEVLEYTTHTLNISKDTVLEAILNTSTPCELICQNHTFLYNYTCVNHTMISKLQCMGGVFTPGTNVSDSSCVECQGSYDVNNVCTAYSMYWEFQCIGGILTLGTNMTDSTCVECDNSYEVNNNCVSYTHNNAGCVGSKFTPGTNTSDSTCDPCPSYHRESDDGFFCAPWTMKNSSECVGGTYSSGTTTADSICYECLVGTFEIEDEDNCTDWTYQSFSDCQKISRRHIFLPGSNSSNSMCLECPVGYMYAFENVCKDCSQLKSHFKQETCCTGMDQIDEYSHHRTPFRAVCQMLLDAWKIDCNQLCYD